MSEHTAITTALDNAEAAFDSVDPADSDAAPSNAVVALREACRLLDCCRLLDGPNRSHASVIEMSFAAIDRSLDCYALATDAAPRRRSRRNPYQRAAEMGLLDESAATRLTELFRLNRAVARSRGNTAASRHADAIFELAVVIHDHVTAQTELTHECSCQSGF